MTPPTSTSDVRVAPIPAADCSPQQGRLLESVGDHGAANVFTTLVRSPYLRPARHGTDHHSMVLADKALRADLGLKPDASCLSVGMQVGSYRQLLGAVQYVRSRCHDIVELPPTCHLGIDYAACVRDPDGHLIQLYYFIEQLGWEGPPSPTHLRPSVTQPWPDAVDAQPDTYIGPAFLGPLG
jgi:hypothetical protein